MRKKTLEVRYIRNRKFLNFVRRRGFPNTDLFKDIAMKEEYLRTYGYEVLHIEGGKTIPLSQCSWPRISHAFLKTYKNAQRQVEKFEAANDSNSKCLVFLVELLEKEQELSDGSLKQARERTAIVMDSAPDSVLASLSREYGNEEMGDYFRQ